VGFVAAEEMLRLPEELAPVDALLDDPTLFVLFAPFSTGGLVVLPDGVSGNRRRPYSLATRVSPSQ
jgi:hypothetical protein